MLKEFGTAHCIKRKNMKTSDHEQIVKAIKQWLTVELVD
jgi:hypothetical protein